jgi:hypothetical protein
VHFACVTSPLTAGYRLFDIPTSITLFTICIQHQHQQELS